MANRLNCLFCLRSQSLGKHLSEYWRRIIGSENNLIKLNSYWQEIVSDPYYDDNSLLPMTSCKLVMGLIVTILRIFSCTE